MEKFHPLIQLHFLEYNRVGLNLRCKAMLYYCCTIYESARALAFVTYGGIRLV